MNNLIKTLAAASTFALLGGCAGDMSTDSSANDGLSGTKGQFDTMTGPCISQASRMTGVGRSNISVIDRIRTGGGPLLTLNVGGAKYSCRMEDNGSVTVFSEYAN